MKPTTKAAALLLTSVLYTVSILVLSGCSTREMKGSPFYTGDYELSTPGAEPHRFNLWPLTYYREPALSVLWPIYEHTEEHLAVRPFFSAYGDSKSYWEYNVLWPLCQADTKSRDYRIFPYFWGTDKRAGNIEQSYHILFPFFWHYEDETHALFPLWISDADAWKEGHFTEHDYWLGWPLMHYHTGASEQAWHVGLVGRYRYLNNDETYTGYPWPLLFSWQTKDDRGFFSPLYAFEKCTTPHVTNDWSAIPILLSWHRRQKDDNDLNALLGLYNQHWSDSARSGCLLPFCAYDREERLLLTPLFGWDKPDAKDPDGYWYPFTPLGGVYTGTQRGSWLFPLYSSSSSVSNDTCSARYLLLGYAKHQEHAWRNRSSSVTDYGFFPLFSHSRNTYTNTAEYDDSSTEGYSHHDRRLILNYSEECLAVNHAPTGDSPLVGTNRIGKLHFDEWQSKKLRGDYRTANTSSGIFPLWSSESRLETRLDGTRLRDDSDSALLLALYDTRRKFAQADASAKPMDYERRRILWRLWHYERRNGDVSVDLFPAITYDTHADGFSKTSFLWRLFRYEKHAGGGTDLDLLFLPLKRAR